MKIRQTFMLLFLFLSTLGYSTIDCTSMQFISSDNGSITISLPTTPNCSNPTAQIRQRVFASGPWSAANFLVDVNANTATISNLDACTDYQFLVVLRCNGQNVGGCANGQPFSTSCQVDCQNCLTFNGAGVFDTDQCTLGMVMDFNAGTCGQISIDSYNWDFGYPGNGGGNTEIVYHTFPANGTYTVTTTLNFTVVATGQQCSVTTTTDIVVTTCLVDCDACIFYTGGEVFEENGCTLGMVQNFNSGTCGQISIDSYNWDFGYPGNGGGNTEVVYHTFPANGTYTVTTTLNFTIVATGQQCSVTETNDITVTTCGVDCDACIFYEGGQVFEENGCTLGMVQSFNAGTCGQISIDSYVWDFGYPGNGGGNTEVVYHTFPGNGTYSVTTTLNFTIVATGQQCSVTETNLIVVDSCEDQCEDCINFYGPAVYKQEGCDVGLVMDFQAGDCGEIKILGYDWDLGYPGNPGGNTEVISHTYPGNGTYEVCATLTYQVAETGVVCTVTECNEVVITDCHNPCDDCINFYGAGIVGQEGCKVEMVMDFNAGTCGEISIISYDWGFGYPGAGTANTEVVTHEFPGDGTYNVVTVLTFEIVGTGEICTVIRTTPVTITDCKNPCEDCINFEGAGVVSEKGCDLELVMDFAAAKCVEIQILGYDWDFGYPGNGGANTEVVTHSFPGNGTYKVTTTLTFRVVETGEVCTVIRCTEVKVVDCINPCEECIRFDGVAVVSQKGCKAELVMDFNAGECGEIRIVSYAWDFGYAGNSGGSTEWLTHTFPCDGLYFVTAVLTFEIVKTGEICSVLRTLKLEVSDCGDCLNGDGGQSDGRSDETASNALSIESRHSISDLTAAPNPTADIVDISYQLTADQKVSINVLDVNGKVVVSNTTTGQAGLNTVRMDLSELAGGVYFYQVNTANGSLTNKLVKQ